RPRHAAYEDRPDGAGPHRLNHRHRAVQSHGHDLLVPAGGGGAGPGGGAVMDFYAVLDQVVALLRSRGRVSYRALKRQFDLDDAYLDDLKAEIIEIQQLAADQDGTMLVWTGEPASGSPLAPQPARAPLIYMPPHLAEKILTSKTALEGERKQVTVLFADLKGSTELIQGLDPEEARGLLDPALHVMMDAVHRYEGTVNQVLGT